MDSLLVKRSVKKCGRRFHVTIERDFWDGLEEICLAEDTTPLKLVSAIISVHGAVNLSSVIRTYILEYFQSQTGCSDEKKNTACGGPRSIASEDRTEPYPRRWLN